MRKLEDDIRLRNRPPGDKVHRWRQILGIAQRRAGVCPSYQSIDILLRERSVVGELAVVGIRKPWRHLLQQHRFFHGLGPRSSLLISEQSERCRFARTMAALTISFENGGHVPRKR